LKDVFSHSFKRDEIKRIFVVDPGCFKESGHNIDLVSRFGKELKKNHEIFVCAPKGKSKFQKLGFDFLSISNLYPVLYIDEYSNKYLNAIYERFVQLSRTIFGLPTHLFYKFIAKSQLQRIIKKNNITNNDLIFFPSSDYYFANAAAELCKKDKINLSLRFIGVLENAFFRRKRDLRSKFFSVLKKCNSQKLALSAETPRYRDYLSSITSKLVEYSGYPIKLDYKNFNVSRKKIFTVNNPLILCLPGKSRPDKGSLDVPMLANACFEKFGMKVIFKLQNFPKGSRHNKKVTEKFTGHFPNIEFMKPELPRDEFEKTIWGSDVILMPYAPDVYYFRGSAIFFESIERGKLVIGRGGSAFSDNMNTLNIMDKYYTPSEFTSLIEGLLNMSLDQLDALAHSRVNKYIEFKESV